MYYIKKFGIKYHIAKTEINGTDYGLRLYEEPLVPEEDVLEYAEKIKGRIDYVLDIDPSDNEMKEYKNFIEEIVSKARAKLVSKKMQEFM